MATRFKLTQGVYKASQTPFGSGIEWCWWRCYFASYTADVNNCFRVFCSCRGARSEIVLYRNLGSSDRMRKVDVDAFVSVSLGIIFGLFTAWWVPEICQLNMIP